MPGADDACGGLWGACGASGVGTWLVGACVAVSVGRRPLTTLRTHAVWLDISVYTPGLLLRPQPIP